MKKLLAVILTIAAATLFAACAAPAEATPTPPPINQEASPTPAAGEIIGVARAEEIALTHANMSRSEVTFNRAALSADQSSYDVMFSQEVEREGKVTTAEHHYVIDAISGKIISYDSSQRIDLVLDVDPPTEETAPEAAPAAATVTAPTPTPAATPVPSGITAEEAKAIALDHAGVSQSDAVFLKTQKDRDDGVEVYDVEFYAGSREYDYEIEASTGRILSYDYDAENDVPRSQTSGNAGGVIISEDEAKAIALDRVPGAANIRVGLDQDDGRVVYEGTIIHNNIEYDFEIDAESGRITEWDAESVFDD